MLKLVVSVFFRVFYITSLSVFLTGFDCTSSPPVSGAFPDKRCDRLPHMSVVIAAVPATVCTIGVSFLMTIAESEQDLLAHDVHASPFTNATTGIFVAITVIDCLDVLYAPYQAFSVRDAGRRTMPIRTCLLSDLISDPTMSCPFSDF